MLATEHGNEAAEIIGVAKFVSRDAPVVDEVLDFLVVSRAVLFGQRGETVMDGGITNATF